MTRDSKDWQKILFKADRSLQIAELIELQELLKNQQSNSFNYLLNRFYVSRPLIYEVKNLQSSQADIHLLGGQIYLNLNRKSYFLDITPQKVTINLTSETTINLLPRLDILEDSDEFRDPLTGGEICGDLGSHREVINYSINLNGDGYLLLKIIPNPFGYPKVISVNNLFSNSYTSLTSSLIEEYLAQRFFEEAGNFILEGLEVSSRLSSVLISPGSAYIQGYKIQMNNPQLVNITQPISFIYLDKSSNIKVSSQTFCSDTFIFIARVENVNNTLYLYPSEDRNILISELELLKNQNDKNEEELTEINLKLDTLISSNFSSSIFIDSFISLKNSNIYHPLYSALINPTAQLVRPSVSFLDVTLENAEITKLSSFSLNASKTIGYVSYSPKVFLSQRRASGFLNLKKSLNPNPILKVSPLSSNFTLGKYITTVKPLNVLSNRTDIELEVSKILKAQEITIEAFGFSPNADNLKITFDNKRIYSFDTLNNLQSGSESSTLKADSQGKLNFKFLVPSDLDSKSYLIEVTNELERAVGSWQPALFNSTQNNLLSSNGEIAQSFLISSPITLVGFNLAFRKSPSSKVETLFNYSINPIVLGKPSSEALYIGKVNNVDISVSSNGSSLTYVPLDFPLSLSSGEYALVINSLSEETDLFISDLNQSSLISNLESTSQQISNLRLFTKNESQWNLSSNNSLTFELIQAVATSNLAEIEFQLTNPLENIDQAQINIKQTIPQTCSSTLFYKSKSQGWIEFKPDLPLDQISNNLSLKLQLKVNGNQIPTIDFPGSLVSLQSNQLTGTWISKNITTNTYQNIKSSFNYYLPLGTSIKVWFSSNFGQTWEYLNADEEFNKENNLVDGNIPLYKATFSQSDLSKTVSIKETNQKTSEILRTNLMMRVDFQTNYRWLIPFIQNFSATVY